MFRLRRKPDAAGRAGLEKARRAAADAADVRQKVEASTGEIMGEVKAHKEILRRNNFADRWRAALGGAGR